MRHSKPPACASVVAPSYLLLRFFDFTAGSRGLPKSPEPLRRVHDSLEPASCPLEGYHQNYGTHVKRKLFSTRGQYPTVLTKYVSHHSTSTGSRRLRAATDLACAPAADRLSASIIGAANELKETHAPSPCNGIPRTDCRIRGRANSATADRRDNRLNLRT